MQLALIVHLLVIMTIYGILAISLNLVVGATGLFNLGHAAFYGIGAYASALLMMAALWPSSLAFPLCAWWVIIWPS